MGLKDQNMALKWVNDHIQNFGGDPKKITITGCSAGGASVHYHYLSPLSAGLFRNGISLSGTTLNSWVQMENGDEKAKKLGALLGCPTHSNEEMIKCLRTRPGRTVVDAVKHFLVIIKSSSKPSRNKFTEFSMMRLNFMRALMSFGS